METGTELPERLRCRLRGASCSSPAASELWLCVGASCGASCGASDPDALRSLSALNVRRPRVSGELGHGVVHSRERCSPLLAEWKPITTTRGEALDATPPPGVNAGLADVSLRSAFIGAATSWQQPSLY